MALIRLENIHKEYKIGVSIVTALRGITLDIRKGEFVCFMGPSGSGKSTLLHIIGALDKPTKGKIFFKDFDLTKMGERELSKFRRRHIGFVFQFFYLVPTLTAVENVMLPLLPVKPRGLEERAKKLLIEVGLGNRLYHKPSELSGGEQQRVAIARALINDPDVIIADEPTGNLDSTTGLKVVSLLKELSRKKGKTLILATHDAYIARLSDRIIFLRDGEIIKEAEPDEVAIG